MRVKTEKMNKTTERKTRKTAHLFQRVIRDCLEIKEEISVSEWAEQCRILDDSSNLSGHWSNSITPYLCEIMDTMNDRNIREVYFCKSTQVGGTEALINMLLYIVDKEPAPTMIVYPSDDLAKDTSTDRLKPAIRMIPRLRSKFLENSSKELKLNFKNMKIYLRGSNSPGKLASKPIKYLFFDEIDKMGGASKKEASPYNLAKERLKTYKAQSKLFACSTPTLKANYIWNLHENADEVRHYFVPCPHCGELIELLFKQVVYDKDPDKEMSAYERAQTARYVCPECGCIITDGQKPEMLRRGEWRAVKKRGIGHPKTVGYWINSLYSIFVTWADAAEEFIKTKDNPEELQNFVNSWLAEPWEDTNMRANEKIVLERQTELPKYAVPSWAMLLTAGVDIQETSVYWTIRAWGKNMTSQGIAHGQVLNLNQIETIMNTEYLKEDGTRMLVSLCLIDSGNDADTVYSFCVGKENWALPCKGSSHEMTATYKISTIDRPGSKAAGRQLVIVDGGKYKELIYARLQRTELGEETGAFMTYAETDDEYARQLTSEQQVMERRGGRIVLKWVPKTSHADNHYLDCEVYAAAAADIMGVRSLHLLAEPQKQCQKEKQPKEEEWIRESELSDW